MAVVGGQWWFGGGCVVLAAVRNVGALWLARGSDGEGRGSYSANEAVISGGSWSSG
jgi:hypothetical protein